jgi:hypothetical protein
MAQLAIGPAVDADLHEVQKVTANMTGNARLGTSLENIGFKSPQAVKWLFDGMYATDEAADVAVIMTGKTHKHIPEKKPINAHNAKLKKTQT